MMGRNLILLNFLTVFTQVGGTAPSPVIFSYPKAVTPGEEVLVYHDQSITALKAVNTATNDAILDAFKYEAFGEHISKIKVPNEANEGRYQLNCTYMIGGASDYVAFDFKIRHSIGIVLQTDKPLYKPGDSIRVRVLASGSAVSSDSSFSEQFAATLELKDPNGFKIGRIVSPMRSGLVGEWSLKTASETELGNYEVKVSVFRAKEISTLGNPLPNDIILLPSTSGTTQTQSLIDLDNSQWNPNYWNFLTTKTTTVEIKEYILPKYEVNLDFSTDYLINPNPPPSNPYNYRGPWMWVLEPAGISSSSTKVSTPKPPTDGGDLLSWPFKVKVTGKYTYGEFVPGHTKIKVYRIAGGYSYYYRKGRKLKKSNFKTKSTSSSLNNNVDSRQLSSPYPGPMSDSDDKSYLLISMDSRNGTAADSGIVLNDYEVDLGETIRQFQLQNPGNYDKIRVEVEVTDVASGEQIIESRDIPVYASEDMFTLESDVDSNGNFQPGLPITITAKLRKPDGTVVTDGGDGNVELETTVKFNTEGNDVDLHKIAPSDFTKGTVSKNYDSKNIPECDSNKMWLAYTSGYGCILKFSIPKKTGTVSKEIYIPRDADGTSCCDLSHGSGGSSSYSTSCCLNSINVDIHDKEYRFKFLPDPNPMELANNLCLTRASSIGTSNLYLSVSPITYPINFVESSTTGTKSIPYLSSLTAKTTISSTTDLANTKWQLILLSRGRVVIANDIPPPITAITTTGGTNALGNTEKFALLTWSNLPLARALVDSSVWNPTAPTFTKSHFDMVSFEIGPSTKFILLANFDTKLISDTQIIDVKSLAVSRDHMDISFKDGELRPGQASVMNLHLNFTTADKFNEMTSSNTNNLGIDPAYLTLDSYLLAIDKSVTLLDGTRAEISSATMSAELAKIQKDLLDDSSKPTAITQSYVEKYSDGSSVSDFSTKAAIQQKDWNGPCLMETGVTQDSVSSTVANPFNTRLRLLSESQSQLNSVYTTHNSNFYDATTSNGNSESYHKCARHITSYSCYDYGVFATADVAVAADAADGGSSTTKTGDTSSDADAGSITEANSRAPKVRTFFPETWIWDRVRLTATVENDDSSQANLDSGKLRLKDTSVNHYLGDNSVATGPLNSNLTAFNCDTSTIQNDAAKDRSCQVSLGYQRPAPDTITTFMLHGFSAMQTRTDSQLTPHQMLSNSVILTKDSADGVPSQAELKVFKPAFVSLRLPYAVIRTEVATLTATIYNYHTESESLTFQVKFKFGAGLSVVDDTTSLPGYTKSCTAGDLCEYTKSSVVVSSVAGSNFKRYTFPVVASVVGNPTVEVQIVASSGALNSDLVSGKFDDAIQKPLNVIPEGVGYEYDDAFVAIDGFETTAQTHNLKIQRTISASHLAPNSLYVKFHITGDVLGPDVLSNLDGLLQMPYGCGEQNILSLSPNIAVAIGYRAQQKFHGAVKDQTLNNMMSGVQRELKYRHTDGGYSAYGQTSTPKAESSLWLTAFVLRVFSDVAQFMEIDSTVLSSAATFIIGQQSSSDGSFIKKGKLYNKSMLGGATSTDTKASLTAFCIITLIRYKNKVINDPGYVAASAFSSTHISAVTTAIANGVKYLRDNQANLSRYSEMLQIRAESDLYLHPLTGFITSWTKDEILNKIIALRETHTNSKTGITDKYWPFKVPITDTSDADEDKYCWWRCYQDQPMDIEMTGYALQSLLNIEEYGSAMDAVYYLGKKRKGTGGFISTQDTIVGLDGLSQFAAALQKTYSSNTVASTVIDILSPVDQTTVLSSVTVSSSNRDLMQSVVLYSPSSTSETGNSAFDTYIKSNFLSGDGLKEITFPIRVKGGFMVFATMETRYNVAVTKTVDGTADYEVATLWYVTDFDTSSSRTRNRKSRSLSSTSSITSNSKYENEVHVCVSRNPMVSSSSIPSDEKNNMLLVKVGMFTGFAFDPTAKNFKCPASRCETPSDGSNSVYLYLEDGIINTNADSGDPDCYVLPVKESDSVTNRQPRATTVIEYYLPEKGGNTITKWSDVSEGSTILTLGNQNTNGAGGTGDNNVIKGSGVSYTEDIVQVRKYTQSYKVTTPCSTTANECATATQTALENDVKAKWALADGFKQAYGITSNNVIIGKIEVTASSASRIILRSLSESNVDLNLSVEYGIEIDSTKPTSIPTAITNADSIISGAIMEAFSLAQLESPTGVVTLGGPGSSGIGILVAQKDVISTTIEPSTGGTVKRIGLNLNYLNSSMNLMLVMIIVAHGLDLFRFIF